MEARTVDESSDPWSCWTLSLRRENLERAWESLGSQSFLYDLHTEEQGQTQGKTQTLICL